MARINSNIPSLFAQSKLAQTQKELQLRFERLSTGLRINRGADDPAGLIISERIRTDIQGVNQGIKNSDRAAQVISTTEASLSEVNELLNSIKSLLVESASTGTSSPEERQANQLQIDSAIDSITRISNTASFGGLKLLNGGLDYTLSGLHTSAISKADVLNASLVGNAAKQVTVQVAASAQLGSLFYNGGATTPTGVLLSATTLEITGANGVQVLSFPSGSSLASVVDAVNDSSAFTGVQASLLPGGANSGMVFQSTEYGSENFVSVRRLGGPSTGSDPVVFYKFGDTDTMDLTVTPFPWSSLISGGTLTTATRDSGRDVSALVNGTLANGRGIALSLNSVSLGMNMILHEDFATDPTATASSFYITGGGALFQLGPDVTVQQQTSLGIGSVAATTLGGVVNGTSGALEYLSSLKSGQSNSLSASVASGDFTLASNILDKAIDEISTLRGRLGAFERNVLQTNSRSLQAAFENLSASSSVIRDADFAFETSQLTRAQILSSAGTSVLSLANQQSQQVLQLLG